MRSPLALSLLAALTVASLSPPATATHGLHAVYYGTPINVGCYLVFDGTQYTESGGVPVWYFTVTILGTQCNVARTCNLHGYLETGFNEPGCGGLAIEGTGDPLSATVCTDAAGPLAITYAGKSYSALLYAVC